MKLSSGTLLTEFSLQNILSWKQQINVSRWTLGLHVLFEFGIFKTKDNYFTKFTLDSTVYHIFTQRLQRRVNSTRTKAL